MFDWLDCINSEPLQMLLMFCQRDRQTIAVQSFPVAVEYGVRFNSVGACSVQSWTQR
jgi:hypothetical protein